MSDKCKNYICRCEEVTKEELEEAIRNGATTMNELKRWTRAGMGLCQGKICSRNVSRILGELTGQKPEGVIPSNARQPVRPVRIDVVSKVDADKD